jgi:NTE family protein
MRMEQTAAPSSGGTVLVLGGGGGRGAAQLGVLRALAEHGIQPDGCVGTSVGALNAAIVAAKPLDEAVALLEVIWASTQTRDVFRSDRMRMVLNRVRRRPYLRSGGSLRELVRYASRLSGITTFEALRIPLRIIMTDLAAGHPVVAQSGPLESALCASASIPGIFPPVRVGERLYVDGGVTENCGLATAATLMPSRVIAVDLSAAAPVAMLRKWSEVIERMMQVALHAKVAADFERFSARIPVTLICPRLANPLRALGFSDFAELREASFAAADRLLQRISGSDGMLRPGVFYLPVPVEA